MCYQIPALLLPGITVVISPLISLMQDQVAALKTAGVPAAYLNRSLTPEQSRTVYRNLLAGRYKILYVAPERRRSFPTPILMYLSKNPEVLARIGERIDYMLISPSLRTSVADAFIYNEGSADYLSDHFPVGIDLCVKIGTESK